MLHELAANASELIRRYKERSFHGRRVKFRDVRVQTAGYPKRGMPMACSSGPSASWGRLVRVDSLPRDDDAQVVPTSRPQLVRLSCAVLSSALLMAGCNITGVHRVADNKLPDAWQKQITAVVSPPNGRFVAAGEKVGSKGKEHGRLEQMFFRGYRHRPAADFVDLATAADGTFTAEVWRNGRLIEDLRHPGRLDPETGWLQIDRVNKYGGKTITWSARAGVGADGTLYVKLSEDSAGTAWSIPTVGTKSWWGRWLPAAR